MASFEYRMTTRCQRRRHGCRVAEIRRARWRQAKALGTAEVWERSGKALEIWCFVINEPFFTETSVIFTPRAGEFEWIWRQPRKKGESFWVIDLLTLEARDRTWCDLPVDLSGTPLLSDSWEHPVRYHSLQPGQRYPTRPHQEPNRRSSHQGLQSFADLQGQWTSKMCPSNRWILGKIFTRLTGKICSFLKFFTVAVYIYIYYNII